MIFRCLSMTGLSRHRFTRRFCVKQTPEDVIIIHSRSYSRPFAFKFQESVISYAPHDLIGYTNNCRKMHVFLSRVIILSGFTGFITRSSLSIPLWIFRELLLVLSFSLFAIRAIWLSEILESYKCVYSSRTFALWSAHHCGNFLIHGPSMKHFVSMSNTVRTSSIVDMYPKEILIAPVGLPFIKSAAPPHVYPAW
jgi:hypothetical protein